MSRWRGVLLAMVLAALFFIENRAAYKGYFSGDDLDTIEWTRRAGLGVFLRGLITPVFNPDNFRPMGAAVYWLLYPVAELSFTPYLAVVQLLHGLNALLIYFLARRRGLPLWPSVVGAAFFLGHMALFDAFWKPMYVFDVLCGTFVLLSLLAWTRTEENWRWWIAAFACFWLAYKSKEMAVMLPAVLVVLEWRGRRRWKWLAPFLLVSLSFGVQALMANRPGEYHLTAASAGSMLRAYLPHLLLWPAGIVFVPLVLLAARQWWPSLAALLLAAPILALAGRENAVYLYVPLTMFALQIGFAALRWPRATGVLLALWLTAQFEQMRLHRRGALEEARVNRAYVEQVLARSEELRGGPGYALDGYPGSLHIWGAEAAVRLASGRPTEETAPAFLSWQPAEERLYLFRNNDSASYLDMSTGTPIRFGVGGWRAPEATFRWTEEQSYLSLRLPGNAMRFECKVFVPPDHLAYSGGTLRLSVSVDGRDLGTRTATAAGWNLLEWVLPQDLQPGKDNAAIAMRVSPPLRTRDAAPLGVAVGAIGFR